MYNNSADRTVQMRNPVCAIVVRMQLYTLNNISNWSFFKLIISIQALIKLKSIVQFNGQKFNFFQ